VVFSGRSLEITKDLDTEIGPEVFFGRYNSFESNESKIERIPTDELRGYCVERKRASNKGTNR
jgi:hypothetical protein